MTRCPDAGTSLSRTQRPLLDPRRHHATFRAGPFPRELLDHHPGLPLGPVDAADHTKLVLDPEQH